MIDLNMFCEITLNPYYTDIFYSISLTTITE